MDLKILKYGNLMGTPDAKDMLQRTGPGTEAAHELWNEIAAIKFAYGYNGQCTTALLADPDRPEAYPALIDPSYLSLSGQFSVEQSQEMLLKDLSAAGATPAEVKSILITHLHPDHYDPGLPDLFPQAVVYTPAGSGLPGSRQPDNQALGEKLLILDTPGHGGPHMSFVFDLDRFDCSVCLAGDLIMSQAHYLDRRHPLSFANHRQAETSIESICTALKSRGKRHSLVFPGHDLPFFIP